MKSVITSIIFASALVAGALWFGQNREGNEPAAPENNVAVVDGKQIIELDAKGGYKPRTSTAKADIPTILRFNTRGTFDCSAAVRIPSMNISKILPQTGSTDIDLGTPEAGMLQGSCGMGMYPFEIVFES